MVSCSIEQSRCGTLNLLRYHANLYRCGETILEEELIEPLYFYFVLMKPEEEERKKYLPTVRHTLERIESACSSAFAMTQQELNNPSIFLHLYRWLKTIFSS